jgi:type 1 glutamine amidotransferase
MKNKKILLLLGGIWHDFEGYKQAMQELLPPLGWMVEATYDMERLLRLEEDGVGLVMSYTCLGKHREGYDDHGPEGLSREQVAALASWVQADGGLLTVHAGTVMGDSGVELEHLLGGRFIEHPPQFTFTVYPISNPHPILDTVEAFSIRDEFYKEVCQPGVEVHLVGLDRGQAYPMAWSKTEGKGRIAHLAPGHNPEVWAHPQFQKLLLQTLDWISA